MEASIRLHCAGALKYTQYDFFKRWMLKRIAAAEGGPIDTKHDYELTNWTEIKCFVDDFSQGLTKEREQASKAMFGWFVRVLLIVAGAITGWFVARDATNFGVLQMFVMLALITIYMGTLAFWPTVMSWFRGQR